MSRIVSLFRVRAVLTCVCLALGSVSAQLKVPPPVFDPPGDTGFVGNISVTISINKNTGGGLLDGKIFYTVNGANPNQQNGTQYDGKPITFTRTSVLRAVHIRSGMSSTTTVG